MRDHPVPFHEPRRASWFQPKNRRELKDAVNLWCTDREAALRQYGRIGHWDVSAITDMSNLFEGMADFNDDICSWDVSNVTDMSYMFTHASAFNQPIGVWDTRAVTSMRNMFAWATAFNQPLDSRATSSGWRHTWGQLRCWNSPVIPWDVSHVTDMCCMFCQASAFNQPLAAWNTRAVRNMSGMFSGATAFNQDVSAWDVSAVRTMRFMFQGAAAFRQPRPQWRLASEVDVTDMWRGVPEPGSPGQQPPPALRSLPPPPHTTPCALDAFPSTSSTSTAAPPFPSSSDLARLPAHLRAIAQLYVCPILQDLIPRCPVQLRLANGGLSTHIYDADTFRTWLRHSHASSDASAVLRDPVTRQPLAARHAEGVLVQPFPVWQVYCHVMEALRGDVAAKAFEPSEAPSPEEQHARKRQRVASPRPQ